MNMITNTLKLLITVVVLPLILISSCIQEDPVVVEPKPDPIEEGSNVSSLELSIAVNNSSDQTKIKGAVVEIYASADDRSFGKNMICSKKTDQDGQIKCTANELNKYNQEFEKINGIYYLNVFKSNLRNQAETRSLDFKQDKLVSQTVSLDDMKADVIIVKVAVVIEDPIIPSLNKRFHEIFKTPGYDFGWHDPVKHALAFEKHLEEASGNTVDYQVVKTIDADTLFTYLKNDTRKRCLSKKEMADCLSESPWTTIESGVGNYDYNAMISYYGFDKMRDNNEIHEVWVFSHPLSGMYESNMMGKDAFWLNSSPTPNPTCTDLLSTMFINYERDIACALESYGHRFESTMSQVYGWWNFDNKSNLSQLTNWERYSAWGIKYKKFENGKAQVGCVHFPPNGKSDYDFGNETYIQSYADDWLNYPCLRGADARNVNRTEWGNPEGSWQLGWMKYYLSHMPHYKGINPNDGKLNNWWNYVVSYNDAIKKQTVN